MPDTKTREPYVRLATTSEFNEFIDTAQRAFIADPVYNYFGNVKKFLDLEKDLKPCKPRRAMIAFLTKACHIIGGRITVVVEKKEGSEEERILSGCLWLPPHKRLEAWMVPTIVRAGILPVLKGWGMTGFRRIVFGYQSAAEKKMKDVFKAANSKASPEESWYLALAFTAPEAQGKGFVSLLIREHIALTPNAILTLEATSKKSRDIYAHLGFEATGFGKGKVDARGINAKKEEAVGVEVWAMAKTLAM
ncbi:hypothetical protein JR316_0010748 [Psilocybe cubensis]|uniref:N-acetyltransferase domain-containing protein n=2 Tax=Psilocybe cubensis TaxID=181762 RepID=A0A8H7XXR8_PSICU|nr:hypothetical protein JR316_0010748 [Psilocybe cubensis]KAH9476833.1 hypothetical protein JR316_0010748 [Psilocybe cubensis]